MNGKVIKVSAKMLYWAWNESDISQTQSFNDYLTEIKKTGIVIVDDM